jgi:hypothetical protein
MKRREVLAAMVALGAGGPALAAEGDLRAAARDAFIFGLPLIEMATTRARALTVPGAALNRFTHARNLAGPESRGVTAPNNDTLYSSAWLDLTQGPVTLTVPPTDKRYISIAGMNMYTDNDFVLGTRTNGGSGGVFTIVGPGQTAKGPRVVRLATPHGWLLARILVDGADDLPAVRRVQDGLRLTGPAGLPPPRYAARQDNALAVLGSIGALMRADPPLARDAAAVRRMAPVSNTDAARFTEAAVREIEAGVAEARTAIRAGLPGRPVQGWNYPPAGLGMYGADYLFRARVALGGLAALPAAEAMYMHPEADRGRMFTGPGPYVLHFAKGQLPPVDGFWSLTMYEGTPEGQFFLVKNPANRYSIGDRTPGLKTNADGSLDIWIARADPGGDKSANWLPAPAEGPFTLSFRAYLPRAALRDGRYRLPAMARA